MLAGGALIASQVLLNLEYLGQAAAFSGLHLAAVALPISMAIAVPALEHCWRDHRWAMAGLAIVVLICGLSHTMIVALERGAHARDNTAANAGNHAFAIAQKAYDDATARVSRLEGAVQAEASKGGCGRNCRALQAQLDAAAAQQAAALERLAKAKAPVVTNSMAKRYGNLAHVIDLVHPLVMPMAMELGGLMLIGFALHRGKGSPRLPLVSAAPPTRLEEAEVAIRKLADDRGTVPSLAEVVRQTGLPKTTAWRARKRVAA